VSNLSKAPFPLLESKHIKDTHGTQRGSFFYKERTSSDVKIKKKNKKPVSLHHYPILRQRKLSIQKQEKTSKGIKFVYEAHKYISTQKKF
jgi:hypothetical protein